MMGLGRGRAGEEALIGRMLEEESDGFRGEEKRDAFVVMWTKEWKQWEIATKELRDQGAQHRLMECA